jgi:VCBS repeat-containing protein
VPVPGAASKSGTLPFTDNNLLTGETHTVSATAQAGALGTLAVSIQHDTPDTETEGQIAYVYAAPVASVIALAQGQVHDDVFTVTVIDSAGNVSTTTLTVGLIGVNDGPVLTVPVSTAAVSEDHAITLALGSNVVDPDSGDQIALTFSVQHGALQLAPAGGVTIDSGNGTGTVHVHGLTAAITALLAGGIGYTPTSHYSGSDTLTILAEDIAGAQSSQQVAITIDAVNDGQASLAIAGVLQEQATLTALLGSDPDGGPSTATYQWLRDGVAISSATGSSYVLGPTDSGHQFAVTVSYIDGQGFAETVTSDPTAMVGAVNDGAALIAIAGAAQEHATLTAVLGSDPDGGPSGETYQWLRDGNAISGATASSYVIAAADAGHQLAVRATYSDGQGFTEIVTSAPTGPVNAVNDGQAPISINGTAKEDETLTVVLGSDPDGGPSGATYQWLRDGSVISGATASTYIVSNADVGHALSVTASYTDGQGFAEAVTSNRTVPVDANHHPAVIGELTVADLTEDDHMNSGGFLVASGTISIDDPDNGEEEFLTSVSSHAGNIGTLDLHADGTYKYSVQNNLAAVQSLGAGDSHIDVFTIAAVDGTTKDVSFTVHGVNDPAQIGDPTDSSVTEDHHVNSGGFLVATGTISIGDVDDGEGTFNTVVSSHAGNIGNLHLDANGTYKYSVLNSLTSVQSLGGDDSHVDVFTIKSADGTEKDVSFTVYGANDPANIGNPTAVSVTEDGPVDSGNHLVASGTISITDVDQGEASFSTTVCGTEGNLGNLDLQSNGAYKYSVNNDDVQSLGAGVDEDHVDIFTIKSVDGTEKELHFTIHGTNDIPQASDDTNDVTIATGDVVISGNLLDNDHDADANDDLFVGYVANAAVVENGPNNGAGGSGTVTVEGTYGELVVTVATGGYTYTLGVTESQIAALGYLGSGATEYDEFVYRADDGKYQGTDSPENMGPDRAHLTIAVHAPGEVEQPPPQPQGFDGASLEYHYIYPLFPTDYVDHDVGQIENPFESFTVGDGVEVTNQGSIGFTIDVSSNHIHVAFQTNVVWTAAGQYHIPDHDDLVVDYNGFRIVDASDAVARIVDVTGFSGATFSDDNVYVNWQGMTFHTGDEIDITVHFENQCVDDPIVVDLGAPGVSLTSSSQSPVRFDLNADGLKEAIGWTSGEDGMLVVDLDHSGSIEDGHEIFSPYFGSGGFSDALDALRSYDSNGDHIIDRNDVAFNDISVWRDANHDGITDPGELGSLSDNGIASIDLNAAATSREINGQQVLAEGEMTLTDGSTGQYVAVGLQSGSTGPGSFVTNAGSAGASGSTVPVALANGNVMQGGPGNEVFTATAQQDTFVFRPGGGHDTIAGFDASHDVIDISGYGINSAAMADFLSSSVTDTAEGAVITFDPDTSVLVQNILKASIASQIIGDHPMAA